MVKMFVLCETGILRSLTLGEEGRAKRMGGSKSKSCSPITKEPIIDELLICLTMSKYQCRSISEYV